MGTIRYIEHTADAGVEVLADSREELFLLGARALYNLMLDYDAVRPATARRIAVAAPGLPDLFHEWLSELLYLLDAEGMVFKKFGFNFADDDTRLEAEALGEEIDGERHRLHGEVKNVTYCDYLLEKRPDGTYLARVIFDL